MEISVAWLKPTAIEKNKKALVMGGGESNQIPNQMLEFFAYKIFVVEKMKRKESFESPREHEALKKCGKNARCGYFIANCTIAPCAYSIRVFILGVPT